MNKAEMNKLTNQAIVYGLVAAVIIGGLIYLLMHSATFAIIGAGAAEFLTAATYFVLEIQKRRKN